MKPIDIYNAPYLKVSTDLYQISHFLTGIDTSNEGLDAQTEVTVRTHYDPYIDGDRGASLYSVWFQEAAVMVCKTGGRPDYEHYQSYVTDLKRFYAMLHYLKSLEIVENCDKETEFNPADDIEDLNIVYCHQISIKDLGPLPHARQKLSRWLIMWFSEYDWPYPFHFEMLQPTLQQKQEMRWPRIQEEAKYLVQRDPKSSKVADLILDSVKGTDEIIRRAQQMLEDITD